MAETFLYLTTTGRVTGNPHKIEIWYVEHEGCFYMCTEHPQKADWVKNIRKNPAVMFYISERGTETPPEQVSAFIVDDAALKSILHEKFRAKYKWSNDFFCGLVFVR